MKMLCISGWKQNGKDSLADYLVANYGAQRVSFADPLKDMAAAEYGVAREAFDLPSLKEQPILSMPVQPQDAFSRMLTDFMRGEFRDQNGKRYGEGSPDSQMYWTPRALAILKGSSNRAVRSDFWVAQAIKLANKKGGLIVISDLRYKSELAQMRAAFGDDMVTVRVQRYDTSPSTDPSERDLDDAEFDFHVSNRGTLADLYSKTESIVESLHLNSDRSQAV